MNTENKTELKRSFGLLDATMLVSGSMIGAGVFIVSADMGRTLGSAEWLIFLWLLTGVITIFAALSYGELAGMIPNSGGQYIYIQRAFGDMTGFLYGWTLFSVIQTGTIAAVAVGFAKYTGYFFPFISTSNILLHIGIIKINSAQILAIILIISLTFINSRGVKNAKMIQLVFTLAKLIALFGLIILGLFFAKHSFMSENFTGTWVSNEVTKNAEGIINYTPLTTIGLILGLGTAIIGPLFASDAWNNVTFIAGEIKDPKRNIPLSLALGTIIVTAIYIAANFAYLNLLPFNDMIFAESDRVGSAAASQIFGTSAAAIMAALIMVSTFGCSSGMILSGARVYYAMSKDGLFFAKAKELNQHNVPSWSLWIQCLWISLLCVSGTYGDLLDYCIFGALFFYIITTIAIFVLRKKEPNTERPYKVPFYPYIPIIYIFIASSICVILLITKTANAGKGLALILIGIPIYYVMKKKS